MPEPEGIGTRLGKAFSDGWETLTHPTQPVHRRNLGNALGTATGITAVGVFIVSTTGCGDRTMPPCELPGNVAETDNDCTQLSNINEQIDKADPTLRPRLTESLSGYAAIMNVAPIEFYFHIFQGVYSGENEGKDNAQPNVHTNHHITDGNTPTVSVHIFVDSADLIPPDDLLIKLGRHEGLHAIDYVLGLDNKPDKHGNLIHTINPDDSLLYSADPVWGPNSPIITNEVKHIITEGQYVTGEECTKDWCNARKAFGHPQDNGSEAFASTGDVMLSFPDIFLSRLTDLIDKNAPLGKHVAQYCQNVLTVIEERGKVPNAVHTMGFEDSLVSQIALLAA